MKAKLSEALTRYDERVATCPVRNLKARTNPRGRVYGPNDACPICGATASGSCGREASASFRLVSELRALASGGSRA